ncbi:glycosyltransferase family 4 protein [Microcoleus sp. FACHB-53]|nr:glycosyltransferase family 4 protein [Microcoleus sp. FACHB-53]
MDSPTRVLSLIENNMGHRTYGNLIRGYFSKSSSCKVDFYWCSDELELPTRVLIKLLSLPFPNQWVRKHNLDFSRSRLELGYAYAARRLADRKLHQAQYSALHIHTQLHALLSVDWLKKLPTVVSIDMTILQAAKERSHPDFRWTYTPILRLEKRVFETAAQVITVSEWARQSVIKDYKINENKVKVIPFSVNVDAITPPSHQEKSLNKPYKILFVGADFKRKGGEDVLDVFLKSFSEDAELHLVTPTAIDCQHPNVHIHSNIKAYTPEWLELYHQADVFVMPTYADALGIAYMEAMAAGLPVIATNLVQITEVVSHKKTGFLIQPGDRQELACRIRDLMENPDLGREMGEKGRLIAERKFSSRSNFQTLESIFKEISSLKIGCQESGVRG